jgi:hypothetical protein
VAESSLACLSQLQQGDPVADELNYDLDGLAVDVFELTDTDVTVQSLTGAHGMTEVSASCSCWSGGVGSCVSA